MSTSKSLSWGLVTFTAAGVLGSYVGYKHWKSGAEDREEQAAALKARHQKKIDQMNARRRELLNRHQSNKYLEDAGSGGNAISDAPTMP
mmetsp:Transcript_16244/g.31459  ORF Transcript_16244/g.31459 Transcript_16244/m.31459 type:complete len:89 (+) Transcript_16244:214-480(+)|eukprot:CAMPEP_0171497370 /NCGR_PEP_ID=MMETSP0958-20121227/7238_1 /TAXON_ID=87120 /ORGANISM="Aurantiochytrium limacinum, Strain ATCCMYA-1381" /LENGTH=88 /DNA_ID=CAMNT_0012031613 /DNA_START=206 /DNA_END=472 /DNA_ORIENTATION=+